ncbi:basic proline-rich protein-like [Cinclus cinclus]|uniref:basic proline-rich protein-like n=1 Tax=Cinclus cinclus TaxID=127875 RepID=UPI002E1603D1
MAPNRFKFRRAEPCGAPRQRGTRASRRPGPPGRGAEPRGSGGPAARGEPRAGPGPAGTGAHSPGAHCGSAPAAGSGRGRLPLPLRSRATAAVTPSLRHAAPAGGGGASAPTAGPAPPAQGRPRRPPPPAPPQRRGCAPRPFASPRLRDSIFPAIGHGRGWRRAQGDDAVPRELMRRTGRRTRRTPAERRTRRRLSAPTGLPHARGATEPKARPRSQRCRLRHAGPPTRLRHGPGPPTRCVIAPPTHLGVSLPRPTHRTRHRYGRPSPPPPRAIALPRRPTPSHNRACLSAWMLGLGRASPVPPRRQYDPTSHLNLRTRRGGPPLRTIDPFRSPP